MRRQDRVNLHRKQETLVLKKGVPDINEMTNGVPTLRVTEEGVVEYVKYNGVMYKNQYKLSTKTFNEGLIDVPGAINLNSGSDLTISVDGSVNMNTDVLTITSTVSTDTSVYPIINLYRNADVDDTGAGSTQGRLGAIRYWGLDTAGNPTVYGYIECDVDDETSGTEDGSIKIGVIDGGSLNNILYIENDRLGINASTPSYMLDVGGGSAGDNVRCYDIYTHDGGAHSSDERMKENIVDSALGLNFINALKPRSYKWKDTLEVVEGDRTIPAHIYKRTHYGLISQEVKQTMDNLSISDVDFAGYIYNEIDEQYQLRYNEFISPLIKAVQELSAKVDAMQIEINNLK